MENTNKSKLIKTATYVFTGLMIFLGLGSVVVANIMAPSRFDLASKHYDEAVKQSDYWNTKKFEARCDLAAIKVAEHESLNLNSDEIRRLSDLLAKCEGK